MDNANEFLPPPPEPVASTPAETSRDPVPEITVAESMKKIQDMKERIRIKESMVPRNTTGGNDVDRLTEEGYRKITEDI